MKTLITQITDCIEQTFDIGGQDYSHRIIIYPCGDIGIQVICILNSLYKIDPALMIDSKKCNYSSSIFPPSKLNEINKDDYVLFLTSTNPDIYQALKNTALENFHSDRILELECMKREKNSANKIIHPTATLKTKVGKYSYGPICHDHIWIKSIGSFCSFAGGVQVVGNHEMRYLTTHPMIYESKNIEGLEYSFKCEKNAVWYFDDVEPKGEFIKKQRRIVIGNDVWFGVNVIITNSANIGNGVIAAAGSVITRDVPDYAIVAGVPARIIRYRYTPEQVEALNKIAWWDWSDDEIRERYDDFYLPIEDFILKYKN